MYVYCLSNYTCTQLCDLHMMHGIFYQVIKRITGGGADYSFECVGDTEMITTALQSCCDVSIICQLLIFSALDYSSPYFLRLSSLGMGHHCYSWCTKSETRDNSSLCIIPYWKNIERFSFWWMETKIWYSEIGGHVFKEGKLSAVLYRIITLRKTHLHYKLLLSFSSRVPWYCQLCFA